MIKMQSRYWIFGFPGRFRKIYSIGFISNSVFNYAFVQQSKMPDVGSFIPKEKMGLSNPEQSLIWMKPPYGRQIGLWAGEAFYQRRDRKIIFSLLHLKGHMRKISNSVARKFRATSRCSSDGQSA
jgi:hypothetical protein